ncbi:unnamed protein product [Callosobruchus maculatus]|uniref:C2H2-type domain-containing protein n=1 Tax=Callosobruchus maculatus TaxID=64391 RepID=A0A653BV44_CALMS|nr:unnamed protein product [Callosobruchus maculatus]VEN39484.1 unnamed protein product [Callosobruchus maculatus]
MKRYTCIRCGSTFSSYWYLNRHKRSICDTVEVPPIKTSPTMYKGVKPTYPPFQAGPSGIDKQLE